jgi:hypothetical protein
VETRVPRRAVLASARLAVQSSARVIAWVVTSPACRLAPASPEATALSACPHRRGDR